MKVLLIEPARYRPDGGLDTTPVGLIPAVTLPRIAALVPRGVDVSICIEMLQPVDFSSAPDIVGITSYTKSVARAYDIADEFRRRGSYVAMGGIHVSMEPQEALGHADTVFVGEAEETWPRFLNDFRSGTPLRLYSPDARPSMKGWPLPRYDLIDRGLYYSLRKGTLLSRLLPVPAFSVETSRGCPHACSFCSVSPYQGRDYRTRPVEDVVAEIKALGARGCFFLDTNLFGDRARGKELLAAIAPLGIIWSGQANLDCADDEELMGLAERSGCRSLTLGMEAISEAELSRFNKSFNRIGEYRRQLKTFSRFGISPLVSMLFVPGHGTRDQFSGTFKFLRSCRVPYTAWWALSPLPGTEDYRRFLSDGRLKRERWWLQKPEPPPNYKVSGPDMSEADFFREFRKYYRRFYSLPVILQRLPSHGKKGWWAEYLWNLLVMTVSYLRRDTVNLYSPLGHGKGVVSFLFSRCFGRFYTAASASPAGGKSGPFFPRKRPIRKDGRNLSAQAGISGENRG